MALTIFASPLHVLPQQIDMPAEKDAVGNGLEYRRRKWLRGKSSWELEVPGKQELLDPIWGLLEYVQGDIPFWFDGAGFGEVTTPIVFAIGDGTKNDYLLPHRHIFVASLVIYNNDSPYAGWTPLGGDAISTCDSIRYDSPLGNGYQATAKYRRRVKVVLRIENPATRSRLHRNDVTADNIHRLTFTLEESMG